MRNLIYAICILTLAVIVNTCTVNKTRVEQIKNGVEIHTEDISVRVQFYTDNMVRIIKWPAKGTAEKTSLAVIMTGIPEVELSSKENKSIILLKSSKLALKVSKIDGRVEYMTLDNNSILEEKGKAEFTPVTYDSDSGFTIKQQFKLTPGEGIYGLGQHQNGYFNYRDKEVKLVQTNTDAINPFLISTENYGILWDNYSKTVFKDTRETTSFWSDIGDNIDYYFILGENMDDVISGYRQLTGTAPMYGKHAYGYWQSKEHYDTQQEIMGVAEKYRRLKYPIDNIIQDWDYWNGAANWSGMFFDKTLFPEPKAMCDRLHAMNFHVIISIWPALGPETPIYADMEKHGFLYKPVGWAGFKYYDAFNPTANKLYWKYLKQGLYSKGLDGWWIDSTEPDVVNALTKESTEYEMKKVGSNYLGSWARYLNAFSLVMTDDIYKFWRKETSDRRAYILTRSTFAGQQRNAATTWSGDIGASWDIYKSQIAAGLNHSMSGIPYWTFDIGAFVIGAYGGVFYNGGKDPAYQELYARMFQFGAFTPIFRSHGSETPREIWEMGEFTETILKYDHLRYRFMPYIYSLAWKVTHENYTIMRGLPMDFTSDRETFSISDQYMFGPSVMVCPVTRYMYYRPPEPTVLVDTGCFMTNEGQKGLDAYYYKDNKYEILGKQQIDPNINVFWYTGRPEYLSDSMFAIRWEGKLIPQQTGKHQFHLKSFDAKRIYLDGKELKMVYTSVEQYTEIVNLVAGKEYNLILETENSSTGAARMQLFWKTPEIFAKEQMKEAQAKTRRVYLPENHTWFDFWTGKQMKGGKSITARAPIDIMPLYVKAGSILPMGPFLQYATEKPADPLELRIYPGTDGTFTLYEDENNNYNYEKGVYATIDFNWEDDKRTLTIGNRKGKFPGMPEKRTIHIVVVKEKHGHGLEVTETPDVSVTYDGKEQHIEF